MFHLFRNHVAFTLVGIIALLLSAIACAPTSPDPTQAPLPTYTPYPTPTPQPTYTPYPSPTSVPTTTPKSTAAEPTVITAFTPVPTPPRTLAAEPTLITAFTPVPTPPRTLALEPTAIPTPTLPPPPEHSTGSGKWLLSDKKDPISDERIIFALLRASDRRLSRHQTSPSIVVACENNVLEVAIYWGEFLGFSDLKVDWRVNDEPASTETWSLFGDDSVYAPEVSQKLSDLLRADKITARVHRDSSSSLTAEWEPEGFAKDYQTIYEACKQ